MKAVDKVTKRTHAICPVLGGFQVCLIPDIEWEDVEIRYICAFLNNEFYARFELVE